MVQILQQGPSEATLRQQALNEAYQNIISGASGIEKAQTLRQQALLAKQEKADAIKRDQEKADIANMIALSKEGIAPEMLRPALQQLKTGQYEKQVISPAVEPVPSFGGIPALMGEKEQAGPIRPEQSMVPKELAGPTLTGQPLMSREMQGPPKPAIQLGKVPFEMRVAIPETEAIPGKEAVYAPSPLQTYSEAKKQKMAEEKAKLGLVESQKSKIDKMLPLEEQKLKSENLMSPIKRRAEEARIRLMEAQAQKARMEGKEGAAGKLERKIIETQAVDTAKTVSNLSKVKDAMDEALVTLRDPKTSEDQKIKAGQGLFKLLNSAEGSDAVGAEEAKRLGSFLEYNLFNITQPGAFIGRDLLGFTDQIANYADLLGRRAAAGNKKIEELKKGKLISSNSQGPYGPSVVRNGIKYNWIDGIYKRAE